MITKWNHKFSCSETASSIQEVFSEVGKRSCYGERDRPKFHSSNYFQNSFVLNSICEFHFLSFYFLYVFFRNLKILGH